MKLTVEPLAEVGMLLLWLLLLDVETAGSGRRRSGDWLVREPLAAALPSSRRKPGEGEGAAPGAGLPLNAAPVLALGGMP